MDRRLLAQRAALPGSGCVRKAASAVEVARCCHPVGSRRVGRRAGWRAAWRVGQWTVEWGDERRVPGYGQKGAWRELLPVPHLPYAAEARRGRRFAMTSSTRPRRMSEAINRPFTCTPTR